MIMMTNMFYVDINLFGLYDIVSYLTAVASFFFMLPYFKVLIFNFTLSYLKMTLKILLQNQLNYFKFWYTNQNDKSMVEQKKNECKGERSTALKMEISSIVYRKAIYRETSLNYLFYIEVTQIFICIVKWDILYMTSGTPSENYSKLTVQKFSHSLICCIHNWVSCTSTKYVVNQPYKKNSIFVLPS